jgi:thymidylate synthase ThyX
MGQPESTFTSDEVAVLLRHFSNTDLTVFALTNLPEVVKGALFARYSRSPKPLRRLFLDEFQRDADSPLAGHAAQVGLSRAEDLYERVFVEYGDDSVAQLAGVHIAVEGASNILTKVLEWGRLMAYLEQSTRYIPYTDRPGGRWRYHVPEEVEHSPLRDHFCATLDHAFETYSRLFEPLQEHLRAQYPKGEDDSNAAYRTSIRAKACDILRGLLPAATTANVGIYGTAQAYEMLLIRLRSHPLAEARLTGERMLAELRRVVPVFMRRVDQPERGQVWSQYLSDVRSKMEELARTVISPGEATDGPAVRLTEYDPEGERKVIAAALYPYVDLPDNLLLLRVREMSEDQLDAVMQTYTGERTNRRHKPGRAFERTAYRFDITGDYGAFRDLQRHRMLTMEWQPLSPFLGYDVPEEIAACGAGADWREVMERSRRLYADLVSAGLADVAPYAVSMAYRIRFNMQMNAREAMHVIELRTSDQAHPNYRRICLEMLRLIGEEAGHRRIAGAMTFAGTSEPRLERLGAERRNEAKRAAAEAGP